MYSGYKQPNPPLVSCYFFGFQPGGRIIYQGFQVAAATCASALAPAGIIIDRKLFDFVFLSVDNLHFKNCWDPLLNSGRDWNAVASIKMTIVVLSKMAELMDPTNT